MEMRTAAEWLNPVRIGGMAAYFVASASCAAVSARAASRRISRLAAILGAFHVVLLLDITFDLRWKLYEWLQGEAVAYGWYDRRHWPQVGMLTILALLLLTGVTIVRRRFASPPGAALAIEGSLLSLGCWATEIISLHSTDAVLYHPAGPLMIISFVWILASAMTTVGIFRAGIRGRWVL